MLPWRALSLAAWVGAAVAKLRVHDASFTPDYVLEVAEQDYKINCEVRRSVAVNGSVPGPEIHLREGRTTWIRVYNRLQGENLTMVREAFTGDQPSVTRESVMQNGPMQEECMEGGWNVRKKRRQEREGE